MSCRLGKRKGKQNTKFKSKTGQTGKGYTAEEAILPETEANEGQWLEPTGISPYDTWQVDSSSWDWTAETDWEEVEGYYQDWETSQDWQSSSSWLATVVHRKDSISDLLSRVSGLLCRSSGQEDDYSQLFLEDVNGHAFLSTKTGCVINLAQNPTYVILDLGCTKSMGSRYAVNKFIKAAHLHGLDYEIIPSMSRFSFANSETTSVHQALKKSGSQLNHRCSPL